MLAGVLAQITTETAALYAAEGLVGKGPATEFLVWRKNADLPDPAALIADPESIDWDGMEPDRVWAAPDRRCGLRHGQRNQADWQSGWKPLATAADHGHAAVAASNARALMPAPPRQRHPHRPSCASSPLPSRPLGLPAA